jgi:hypothetical protein
MPDLDTLSQQLTETLAVVRDLAERQLHFEQLLVAKSLNAEDLVQLNPMLQRNFIENGGALQQKLMMQMWDARQETVLGYADFLDSGFRAFSQNDEDGVLLRLFAHIGYTNRCVMEIGSNCSDSLIGIPENLSTNLMINHGWHGAIFEMDATECSRMRYFFARAATTRHYHWVTDGKAEYYSPLIVEHAVTPENVDGLLKATHMSNEPDLFIIDIDGGDYAVMERMTAVNPRVIVVEFEKRFREIHSVVQRNREDFSTRWQQSGAASLTAWVKLLAPRGYTLCTVGSCCFNAFFVRNDVAHGKLHAMRPEQAFVEHPVFSAAAPEFWLTPDETWEAV